MEMTQRLLQTGLNLEAQGEATLAALIFAQVLDELRDRNRLMEARLYPLLAESTALIEENRRLERLASAQAWSELAGALILQLTREGEVRHLCSLRPLGLAPI